MITLKYLPKCFFAIKWSSKPSQVLSDLRMQSKKNPNAIKQSGMEIINHLADLIEEGSWKQVNTFLREIKVGLIEQWSLWRIVVKAIDKVSENQKHLRNGDFYGMLEAMFQLRYEPYAKDNPELYNFVRESVQSANFNKFMRIAAYFLQYDPPTFKKYQEQVQSSLLNEFQATKNLKDLNYYVFTQGVVSNFWSEKFMTSMGSLLKSQQSQPRSRPSKFTKYLELPNLSIPQHFRKATAGQPSLSATEQRIGLLLADLGYCFDRGVYINGTQVDFYFQNCKMIVEYDGMTHYRLNQIDGRIYYSKYMRWRNQCFKARGFTVVRIPFFDWKNYQGEKAQKLFLINKIERTILKKYERTPETLKDKQ